MEIYIYFNIQILQFICTCRKLARTISINPITELKIQITDIFLTNNTTIKLSKSQSHISMAIALTAYKAHLMSSPVLPGSALPSNLSGKYWLFNPPGPMLSTLPPPRHIPLHSLAHIFHVYYWAHIFLLPFLPYIHYHIYVFHFLFPNVSVLPQAWTPHTSTDIFFDPNTERQTETLVCLKFLGHDLASKCSQCSA